MPTEPTPLPMPPSPYQPDWIRTYKTTATGELKAHGFSPKELRSGEKKPGFAFFHPGGWNMGEPAWGYELCHHYAGLGMVAVSFQYRLSSIGGTTPVDAISDARSAVRWIRRIGAEIGLDGDRLLVMGISAGAHLALSTAMLGEPDDPADDTTISTVANALLLQSASADPASGSQFIELLQGKGNPEDYSPAHHIRPGLPPMCFIHGTADDIVSHDSVKEFVAVMKKAGNSCELHSFEGTDHFFRGKDDQVAALRAMDAFVHSHGYIS
jgi:acetyl esterase